MSFMIPAGPRFAVRSYGWRYALVQILLAAALSLMGETLIGETIVAPAYAQTATQVAVKALVKIVALGDSLTAGYGLPDKDGFVPQLQAALTAKGVAAGVQNAGVSGDTASDGLARLDWSVPQGTDAVIVELGANDMLRGISPDVTRKALDAILSQLTERHIAVLLCGMRAAPNLGPEYVQAFERIYPDLAAKYGVPLYPFFLDGVAADPKMTQHDGLHPNEAGVKVIVQRILPKVEELIAHVQQQHPS
jgi:acyl-CoA thioesterase I